ncbi:MAG: DegT/DnrJ/EryC1/StrS family aminotransferase [Methanobrevibacter sp.]|nr:DegT/DnrJ/EryC1/StrS family aminotransferase [Methanobrevibacter sp.]
MNLKFKKPSKLTQIAMSKVASCENKQDFHSIAEAKLSEATNHEYAKLVSSGNGAILTVMNSIGSPILIPDQGGWNGFKQIARFLNRQLVSVNTNQGLVTVDYLEEAINQACNEDILNLDDDDNKPALFLTSFAAYTAEQDIKEISKFLHKNNMLLVEDASGAICDSKERLANGKYSDIIIGSTGSPKIINVEDGGFITTNDDSIFKKSNLILKTAKCSNITACGISQEIEFAKANLDKTVKFTMNLKEKINDNTDFEVFHVDKRGINLILKTIDSKSLSYNLRQEFALDSHGMVTKGPNYNRLKEKSVAIEIKNLDISCLTDDNLDKMVNIIKQYEDLA